MSVAVDEDDRKVLGHFLTADGRLSTIPTKRSSRGTAAAKSRTTPR